MARQSLAEFLTEFERRGNETAYIQRRGYRTVRWSYRQVAGTASQFAQELESRGIGKGDRVLIWGPNSAEWVAVFLGCAARGVVAVPIDDAARPEFAERVATQVSAKLMVCSRQHAAATATPFLILEDWGAKTAQSCVTPMPAVDLKPEDTLEIVFTSGTTAEPKGVVISHGNVLANMAPLETEAQKYLKYERLVHPVRFLNLLPLSHVFGQFLGIFLPPLLGAAVVFQENLKPADVVASIRRERVSVLVAVPRVLQSLKEKIERDFRDENRLEEFRERFGSSRGKHFLWRWWVFREVHRQFGWKFWAFISGGATLDLESEEFWGRLGYAVIQGYGLTETTSLISVNHPFRLGEGSIGKVLAGREVKIAPDGEILVRGGGVASGYWDARGGGIATSDEGWYRTGDLGAIDAEGHLYFKGRKKDVIVTPAGMNVYPQDLEGALRRQPEIRDCVVIALPRDGNAEPCAVVILREGALEAEAAVRRANESLAEFQRMRFWLVWPEEDFPRTSTQKPIAGEIQHFALAHFSQQAAGGAGSSPLADLISRVAGNSPERLNENSNLDTDLNLSSLDRVELLGALEDRYQMDLSETGFASVRTVGDLEKMLHGTVPRARYHYPRWVLRWPVTWIRLLAHYLLLRPAVMLLGWPRISGRENLRGVRGPALVICNHLGDADLGFVLTALPVRFRHHLATATGGEALEALRTPPSSRNGVFRLYERVRWALGVSLLNLFPLPREAGFRESFAYAGECFDRGYSVLVFPEGRHTTTGRLLPFRAGIGLLVKNLGAPVIPMRIDGLFELKQAGKKFAPPGQIRVKIGVPVRFSVEEEPEQIAGKLQQIVEGL